MYYATSESFYSRQEFDFIYLLLFFDMLYCLKKHKSFILEFDSYLKIICFVGQAMRHQYQKNKKQKKERIKIKFMQEQR